MSLKKPTKAYVYQPEADGSNDGYIWAVAGPGSSGFMDERFRTRDDACFVADALNRRTITSEMLKAIGRTKSAQAAIAQAGR